MTDRTDTRTAGWPPTRSPTPGTGCRSSTSTPSRCGSTPPARSPTSASCCGRRPTAPSAGPSCPAASSTASGCATPCCATWRRTSAPSPSPACRSSRSRSPSPSTSPTPSVTGFHDPRQHAISLAFVVAVDGDCAPAQDSLDLTWVTPEEAVSDGVRGRDGGRPGSPGAPGPRPRRAAPLMDTAPLGPSGLEVSRLALGSWRTFERLDRGRGPGGHGRRPRGRHHVPRRRPLRRRDRDGAHPDRLVGGPVRRALPAGRAGGATRWSSATSCGGSSGPSRTPPPSWTGRSGAWGSTTSTSSTPTRPSTACPSTSWWGRSPI